MITRDDVLKLCDLITADQLHRHDAMGLTYSGHQLSAHASIAIDGSKYFSIDIGTGCRYFVRKSDGVIFASASCKKPNFNRSFGTVASMHDFYWGNYEARALDGTPWMMVDTRGGYQTAVALPPVVQFT